MADTSYEGVATVILNGRTLAECKKITVSVKSNDNVVKTMAKQFAGFSDGAGETSINIEMAVPKKGFEYNFVRAVVEKRTVQIVYKSGGVRHQCTGRIMESEMSNDVESPAMNSGTFSGGLPTLTGG